MPDHKFGSTLEILLCKNKPIKSKKLQHCYGLWVFLERSKERNPIKPKCERLFTIHMKTELYPGMV